jgi:hypothetical protein
MSELGMEMQVTPSFEFGNDETGGPAFFWINPWSGQREKIASLWWPAHPPEATESVEQLFSELRLYRLHQPPSDLAQGPTEPPDGYRAAWLEMIEHCNKLKEENFNLRAAAQAPTNSAEIAAINECAPAIENLTNHQEQCDMDGVMVKVSRQALDEVLSLVSNLARSRALAVSSTHGEGWK